MDHQQSGHYHVLLASSLVSFIRATPFIFFILIAIAAPSIGQPTGFRDFGPQQRRRMTEQQIEKVKEVSRSIDHDPRNVDHYLDRLQLYRNLLELNYDNSTWDKYADAFAADLWRLVKLGQPSNALSDHEAFMRERITHSPVATTSEFNRKKRFFKTAIADLAMELKRSADAQAIQYIYSELGSLYSLRAKLAASLPIKQNARAIKRIRNDLKTAERNEMIAWEMPWNRATFPDLPDDIARVTSFWAGIYLQLNDTQAAITLYDSAQRRIDALPPPIDFWKCDFYAGWANTLMILDRPAEARSKLAEIPHASRCDELKEVWTKWPDIIN